MIAVLFEAQAMPEQQQRYFEGGGVFSSQTGSHAHFLVEEGERARAVLENHGLMVVDVIKPLIRRLRQERSGAAALDRKGARIS